MVNIKDIMKLVQLLVEAIPYLLPLLEMVLKMKKGRDGDEPDGTDEEEDERWKA